MAAALCVVLTSTWATRPTCDCGVPRNGDLLKVGHHGGHKHVVEDFHAARNCFTDDVTFAKVLGLTCRGDIAVFTTKKEAAYQ